MTSTNLILAAGVLVLFASSVTAGTDDNMVRRRPRPESNEEGWLRRVWDSVDETVIDAVEKVSDEAKGTIQSGQDWVEKEATDVKNIVSDTGVYLFNLGKNATKSTISAVNNWGQEVTRDVEAGGEWIVNKTEGVGNGFVDGIHIAYDWAINETNKLEDEAENRVETIWNMISGGAKEAWGAVASVLPEIMWAIEIFLIVSAVVLVFTLQRRFARFLGFLAHVEKQQSGEEYELHGVASSN